MSQQKIARITGISLLVMAVVAGGIMAMVYAPIFSMESREYQEQFDILKAPLKFGAFGWGLILFLDLQVSWGLYKFYRTKSRTKAIITGILRLVYSILLLIAIVSLIQATFFSENAYQSFQLIQRFQSIWQFGLIIFGVHLLSLAPLVCGNSWLLKVIAATLLMAGIGYVLIHGVAFFSHESTMISQKLEPIFVPSMVLGEVGLAFWLLLKKGEGLVG